MIIVCATCEQPMEVHDSLEDGQHVKCPFCGAESVCYKKSSSSPSTDSFSTRPKLGIRRPANLTPVENSSGNAFAQRVQERVRADEKRTRWRKVREKIGNLISIVFLLGLLYAGWCGYVWWRNEQKSENADSRQELLRSNDNASRPSKVEKTSSPTKESVQRRESKRPETKENLRSARNQVYEKVLNRFTGAHASVWSALSKERRPGRVDGRFSLWVPLGNSEGRFFEIISSSTGIVSVVQQAPDKESRSLITGEYEKLLIERGGFIADEENTAYYVSARNSAKVWSAPLRHGKPFDAAAEYFAACGRLIQDCKMDVENMRFAVSFAFSNEETPTPIATVKFGETITYKKFRNAIEDLSETLHRNSVGSKPVYKPYHATVIFYDGTTIASGVNGVTKVPRTAPRLTGSAYDRWLRLRNEAYLQESKSQECENAYRRELSAWKTRKDAPLTESEIERILAAGSVHIKRM